MDEKEMSAVPAKPNCATAAYSEAFDWPWWGRGSTPAGNAGIRTTCGGALVPILILYFRK